MQSDSKQVNDTPGLYWQNSLWIKTLFTDLGSFKYKGNSILTAKVLFENSHLKL